MRPIETVGHPQNSAQHADAPPVLVVHTGKILMTVSWQRFAMIPRDQCHKQPLAVGQRQRLGLENHTQGRLMMTGLAMRPSNVVQ